MTHKVRALGGAVALAALASCSSGTPSPASAPAPVMDPVSSPRSPSVEATTADGIFTVAQAERGAQLYRSTCAECHDTEDWTDASFRGRWADESVFQLWYYINDRMPYDDPWSLSRQQVTDVLTYILELNDLPAGATELATDDDSIDDYWIAWPAN